MNGGPDRGGSHGEKAEVEYPRFVLYPSLKACFSKILGIKTLKNTKHA